ncbi:hypothetical protein [Moorena sp. SIO3A2]|uniref:hypothetical protein n=1 Tax=Moorena sp. SIO3A2 TaxID=2607841 RepID=UPI0013B5B2A4|nr:hypothetical protein [Moorena sp. SIO3A2]NER90410.1 hypothetical protein [Moorena sp. SIO3A2]
MEGNIKDNKPIWYRFRINYYSGKASPFPKYLKAEWGFYESTGGELKRGPLVKSFSQSPEKPELTPVTPNLNDPDVTAGDITRVTDVDRGFVLLLLNVREENGGSLGTSRFSVKNRMEKKYITTDVVGGRQVKFGVKDFDARMNLVLAAIKDGKATLK